MAPVRIGFLAISALLLTAGLVSALPIELPNATNGAALAAPPRTPTSDDGREKGPATRGSLDFTRERSLGDPLALADPDAWLPILARTRSVGAAAAAAEANLTVDHTLYSLGDANGDGRADFLHERTEYPLTWTRKSSDENFWEIPHATTITATAGGAYGNLWSREIPSDAYWYPLGDVTGDDVHDLVVLTATAEGTGTGACPGALLAYGCVETFEQSYTEKHEVVSGATGQTLFTRDATSTFSGTFVLGVAVVAVGWVEDYHYARTFIAPTPEGDLPGLDVYTVEGDETYALASGGGLLWLWRDTSVLTVDRLDPAGKPRWSATVNLGDDAAVDLYDLRDYTGDGVPDVLVGRASYSTALIVVAIVAFQQFDLTAQEMTIVLIDGATGKEAWRRDAKAPLRGYLELLPAGALEGDGLDLLLHEFGHLAGAETEYSTRMTAIDGATGDDLFVRDWPNQAALGLEFADADRDGRGDLLHVAVPVTREDELGLTYVEATEASVVTAEFDPIWSFSLTESDYVSLGPTMPDFDGDGVPDAAFETWDEHSTTVELRSGADGSKLWTLALNDQDVSGTILDDVTGDGKPDIANVHFDIPNRPDCCGDGFFDWYETNYANYTGTLEIRRGIDGAVAWTKTVHTPDTNLSGEYAGIGIDHAGDVNGNGFGDVLFDLSGYPDWDFEYDEQAQLYRFQIGDGRPRLETSMVIEGGSGATVCSFPGACTPAPAGLTPTDVQLGEGAPDQELVLRGLEGGKNRSRGILPGFELVFVALAVVAVALARRLRAS